jgi:hypothetical protein
LLSGSKSIDIESVPSSAADGMDRWLNSVGVAPLSFLPLPAERDKAAEHQHSSGGLKVVPAGH